MNSSYETLDEALDSMASVGPELANGFTNHAPMVVEALCSLRRGDAVMKWLAGYRRQFMFCPAPHQRITDRSWRGALGRLDRFPDWQAFLKTQLQEMSWTEALDRWTMRLATGFSAAAMHGPIRVGHAARALAAAETPSRLHELASALAYWAAAYQTLPWDMSSNAITARPGEAVRKVPVIPDRERRLWDSISSALTSLDNFQPFATAIGLADLSGDSGATLSELAETFAGIYLENAHDVLTSVIFIHGVTSFAAVRNMASHVGNESRRLLLRYAWQSACALLAVFGVRHRPVHAAGMARVSSESLIEAAISTGDEHSIKFIEVCIREDALQASPLFRLAASRATRLAAGAINPSPESFSPTRE